MLGNFIVDCTKELDPMTEGMLKMMGVFSELECNMILERVKSGMANAKAKGKLIGRPTTAIEDVPVAVTKAYELLKNGKINKSECARMCISQDHVYINILRLLKRIKLNDEIKTELKPKDVDNTANDEVSTDTESFNIKDDYINTLKQQFNEKDSQIKELPTALNKSQELHQNT